jgi:maltose-binding protein MalE
MLSPEAQALLADPTKAGHIPAISGIDVGGRFVNEAYRALRDGVAYPVTPEIDAYWAPLENAIKSVLEQGKEPGDALVQAEDEVKTGLEEMRNIE